MKYLSRQELLDTPFRPHVPYIPLISQVSRPDGSIEFKSVEPVTESILRSSDFDVSTILETNPSLLQPVGKLHPDILTEHDQFARVAASLVSAAESETAASSESVASSEPVS